jgi:hypothetical protein
VASTYYDGGDGGYPAGATATCEKSPTALGYNYSVCAFGGSQTAGGFQWCCDEDLLFLLFLLLILLLFVFVLAIVLVLPVLSSCCVLALYLLFLFLFLLFFLLFLVLFLLFLLLFLRFLLMLLLTMTLHLFYSTNRRQGWLRKKPWS